MEVQNPIPSDQQQPRLSNMEVADKAADARALLNDNVLVKALNDIYSKAAGTLVSAEIGSLTATHAHAMMKAVLDLEAQLKEYVADDKLRQKYNKGDK